MIVLCYNSLLFVTISEYLWFIIIYDLKNNIVIVFILEADSKLWQDGHQII